MLMFEFIPVAFIAYAFSIIVMEDVAFGYTVFLQEHIPLWLAKPLGLCPICFTGQLTLWTTIYFVNWTFMGVLAWLATISLNMIITLILMRYVKGD
jgi:hypothetical protein